MVHDLLTQVLSVHTMLTSLTKLSVQATSVAAMLSQSHALPDHVQESVQGSTVHAVTEQRLLAGLTNTLIDHAELKVVDQHVLVVVDEKLACSRTEDELERGESQLRTNEPSK